MRIVGNVAGRGVPAREAGREGMPCEHVPFVEVRTLRTGTEEFGTRRDGFGMETEGSLDGNGDGEYGGVESHEIGVEIDPAATW